MLAFSPLRAQYLPGGATPLLWFDANQGTSIVGGSDDNMVYWQSKAGTEDKVLPAGALPDFYSLRQTAAANRPNLRDTALWLPHKAVHFVRANSNRLAVVSNANAQTVNNNVGGFAEKMFSVAFSLVTLPSARMIIFKEGNQNIGINLFVNTANRLEAGVWNNAASYKSAQSAVLSINTKYIATVVFKSGIVTLYVNGTQVGTSANLGGSLANHSSTTYALGGGDGNSRYSTTVTGTGNYLNGHIAEFVYSNNVANDMIRIGWENYLSEKYSIALGTDRFTPTLATYNSEVVAIGRVDAANIVTETDFGSAGLYLRNLTTIVDDGDYLLAGHNNTSGFTTTGTNAGRLNREWVLHSINTGGSGEGNVTLMFDPIEEGSTAALLNRYDYYLLVDGVQNFLHQGYIESGRICFDVNVSAVKDRAITLATEYTVNYSTFRYQPGGSDDARFWYTATASQRRVRRGSSAILRLYDQSSNAYDARLLNSPTIGAHRFTDVTPSYIKDGFGLGAHAFDFNIQAPTTGDMMHVLSATGGNPDNLNGLQYDKKMIIAFFLPNNASFTGNQMIYEQGTAVDGFNLYLSESGGTRTIYTGTWRNNGNHFNIYHNTALGAAGSRYLLSWTFSRLNYARVYSHLNGTQFGNTLIGGGTPPYELRAIAGDNVGIGGIYNGTRRHTDPLGTITSATNERLEGYIGDLLHYTDDRFALRRIVENALAAKYNHPLATPLFDLTAAGAVGCTNELIGIGRELAVISDEVTATDVPGGGLFVTNSSFIQNDGDYLLLAHNNALGVKTPYNGPDGQLWNKLWYVDLTDVGANGGNVTLSFAIDQEGSDRQLYIAAQYFIRDSTNHAEIGLGTAVINTVSATDRRVEFTLSVNSISDRVITLGVRDRSTPVQCNCLTGDDDADGLNATTDPDCLNPWNCPGEFDFTEFSPGGDPNQATSLRRLTPGSTLTYNTLGATTLLRKLDASGFNRRDRMVYGFINEGAETNRLVRVQGDGTALSMGVPQAGSTTFPAGASQFVAGDCQMYSNRITYAFANNAVGGTKYIGVVRFDGFTKPTVTFYNAMSFSDAPAGVPNFTDMAFDPSVPFNTNLQAYAYDINDRKLIRINSETGSASRVSATSLPYSDIEALYFTEFGELYGWGVNGGTRELVHINKTDGTMSVVGTGADLNQIDGCTCGNGLGIRVYPVANDNVTPITETNSNTTVKYRVDMTNNSGIAITGIQFSETFSDGREFTAFDDIGSITQPNISINGGGLGVQTFTPSNAISITGLRAQNGAGTAPVVSSFVLTVSIPSSLSNSTVYTQPLLDNLTARWGTSKSTDYVITTTTNSEYLASNVTLRDATPLIITTPLPVEWAAFEATPENGRVLLEWSTFQEENNAYFTAERSTDGQNWAEIGQLDGAGTTQELRWYSLYDLRPNEGLNHYRIRQTDIDGKSAVSETRTVVFSSANGLGLQTYPNPASPDDWLNVQFIADGNDAVYTIQVIDLSGKVLMNNQVAATQGANVQQIPLQGLAKGMYLIQVSNEFQAATQKLIVR